MSRIARFGAYAAAFESAFESDDWAPLEPFFTENAVYDAGLEIFLGGRADGREEILAFFKAFLDGFDRRFESRELALLEGPVEEGQAVRLRGAATYRAAGVPDFVLVLEETITFEGDRITRLEDRYDETMAKELEAYVEEHGDALGFALSR